MSAAPLLLMSMIACELIAKLCFWVFFFTTLHLPYSDYYLSTLTRQFTSFVEGKFLRLQPRFVLIEQEERVDRGLKSCSPTHSNRTHALRR